MNVACKWEFTSGVWAWACTEPTCCPWMCLRSLGKELGNSCGMHGYTAVVTETRAPEQEHKDMPPRGKLPRIFKTRKTNSWLEKHRVLSSATRSVPHPEQGLIRYLQMGDYPGVLLTLGSRA